MNMLFYKINCLKQIQLCCFYVHNHDSLTPFQRQANLKKKKVFKNFYSCYFSFYATFFLFIYLFIYLFIFFLANWLNIEPWKKFENPARYELFLLKPLTLTFFLMTFGTSCGAERAKELSCLFLQLVHFFFFFFFLCLCVNSETINCSYA